jgi:PTS system nitrogen regulatory IIA component
MSLESMIPSGAVVVPLLATDVDEALVELSQALAHAHGLRADRVLLQLREREQLGSTAIGEGVALPHGRGEVEHTVGALGISPRGVRWGDARVHMVVALLSPLEGSEHVKALARIGRVLSDARLTAALREVTSAPQAHALLVGVSQ